MCWLAGKAHVCGSRFRERFTIQSREMQGCSSTEWSSFEETSRSLIFFFDDKGSNSHRLRNNDDSVLLDYKAFAVEFARPAQA